MPRLGLAIMAFVLGGVLPKGERQTAPAVTRTACDSAHVGAGVSGDLDREAHAAFALLGGRVLRWPWAEPRTLGLWVQRRSAENATHRAARTPAHSSDPLDQPAAAADDRAWASAVVAGALDWRSADVGLALAVTEDSAAAHLRVLRTPLGAAGAQRSGVVADTAGRIEAAWIRLGEADLVGRPYRLRDVRAAAAHEVGHALGLTHRAAAGSIMTADVRADTVSASDRALLRVWYAHPAGRVCVDAARR